MLWQWCLHVPVRNYNSVQFCSFENENFFPVLTWFVLRFSLTRKSQDGRHIYHFISIWSLKIPMIFEACHKDTDSANTMPLIWLTTKPFQCWLSCAQVKCLSFFVSRIQWNWIKCPLICTLKNKKSLSTFINFIKQWWKKQSPDTGETNALK